MATIQTSTDFDVSSVQFGKLSANKYGGKMVYLTGPAKSRLQIQLPFLRCPFGLSSYTDEATKKVSYSLDLSLDSENQDAQHVMELLGKLDDAVLTTAAANSMEWFGKPLSRGSLEETLYTSTIRRPKDASKGYAPTLKLKIRTDKNDKFVPEAYDMKQNEVALSTIEKGQYCMAIFEVSQISFVRKTFGVTLNLLQILLKPSSKLQKFAFKLPVETLEDAASEEAGDEEEEYEEEEEVDI